MDLNDLSLFVSAARAGSLSAASRRTGTPLPTLSRRIRALESAVDARLVERSVRGLSLTSAGQSLYEAAAEGLDSLDDALLSLREAQQQVAGVLRVSIPPDFEPWWVLLSSFRRSYPAVDVHAFVTERRVDLRLDGVDVALRIGEPGEDDNVARVIGSYRHVVLASPALVQALGTPRSVGALSRFPIAAWAGRSATKSPTWSLGAHQFSFTPAFVSNQYAHLRALALSGDAVTELPPFLAAPYLARGELVPLLPRHPLPEQKLSLVFRTRRHMSSLLRAYIDHCVEQAPALLAPPRRESSPATSGRRKGKAVTR